jgi:hypothetical protein
VGWNEEHVLYLQRKMVTFFVTGIYVKEKKKKIFLNSEWLNINEEIIYVKVTH